MKTNFENIYDAYCPLLYSIALQVCPSKERAEDILILTFLKLQRKKVVFEESRRFCFQLNKLMIETAQEELHPGKTKCDFKIKQFEDTPLLHLLLVEQLSIDDYCSEYKTTKEGTLLKMRQEILMVRKKATKSKINHGLTA